MDMLLLCWQSMCGYVVVCVGRVGVDMPPALIRLPWVNESELPHGSQLYFMDEHCCAVYSSEES